MENLTLSVIKLWQVLSRLSLQKGKKYLAWEIIKFNAFMVNKKPIMKWKKLYQLRPNLKQSRLQLLLLRIKQPLNLLSKMPFKFLNNIVAYKLLIVLHQKIQYKLNQIQRKQINKQLYKIRNHKNLVSHLLVLMLMLNTKLLMKLIKLFHLLIIMIQDGQLMFVNFKNIIQSTVHIVRPLKKLKSQHRQAQTQNQIKLKKAKNLEEARKRKRNLKKFQLEFKNGVENIKPLMKLLIN